jgi:hypothetical protein
MTKCGVVIPRRTGCDLINCRVPGPEASAQTEGEGRRQARVCGPEPRGVLRARSIASPGVWRSDAAHKAAAAVERVLSGRAAGVAPLIVAIARSVAVGKSTFARILYSIRTQVPTSRKVVLVATERLPTKTLLRRELMVQIPEQDVQPF